MFAFFVSLFLLYLCRFFVSLLYAGGRADRRMVNVRLFDALCHLSIFCFCFPFCNRFLLLFFFVRYCC